MARSCAIQYKTKQQHSSYPDPGPGPPSPNPVPTTPHPEPDSPQSDRNTVAPEGLNPLDVACIIIQRMVGTGIFTTTPIVLFATRNAGATLMFWVLGGLVTLLKTFIYVEYAGTLPRFSSPNSHEGHLYLPMNGGELAYFCNMLRGERRFFASCVFGMAFVVLGNSAANCIAFGHNILGMGQDDPVKGHVILVAMACSVVVCFCHAAWRRLGIWINNFFAVTKVLFLLLIIVLGFAAASGDYPSLIGKGQKPGGSTTLSNAFGSLDPDTEQGWKDYSLVFVSITFAFGGWNQANYVMGDARMCPKVFKTTVLCTVFGVWVLYMLVTVAFLLVVNLPPKNWDTFTDQNLDYLPTEFFERTIGHLNGDFQLEKFVKFFLAFSSLGNVLVTTFTSARVKQEIGKEGVFFYEHSIAIVKGFNLHVRDWLSELLERDPVKKPQPQLPQNAGRETGEQPLNSGSEEDEGSVTLPSRSAAPTPALALHCVFSIIIIAFSAVSPPQVAYTELSRAFGYLIDTCIPLVLLAALILNRGRIVSYMHQDTEGEDRREPIRDNPSNTWRFTRIIAAALAFVVDLFVVLFSWVPPRNADNWFVSPLLAVGMVALGTAWFLVAWDYRWRMQNDGKFCISREALYSIVREREYEYMVVVQEKIRLDWLAPSSLPK